MITAEISHADDLQPARIDEPPHHLRGRSVNWTSGTTANGSCRLSMTWLSTSSFAVPLSP